VRRWWAHDSFRFAASLAFYTIFSLAPVLVISVSISAIVFDEATATREIVSQVEWLVGKKGGEAVEQAIAGAREVGQSPLATAIGLVMLVVGSTVVFAELQAALNAVWEVKVDPPKSAVWRLLRVRLRSFAIVLAVGFLLMVSLVVSAVLSALQAYMEGRVPGLGGLWQAANFVVSFLILTMLFAMIYKYLPDVRISWSDVWVGAGVTAFLFTLGKYLIGLYLGQVAIGSAYGAAGSLAVLLIWTYYAALISFFGAEFTYVWARSRRARVETEEFAVRVPRREARPRGAGH
jgi:membrane protein